MAKYRCERCGAELPNFETVFLKKSYGTYWQYILCQNCTDKLMNWMMPGTENTECINGGNRQIDNEVENNGIQHNGSAAGFDHDDECSIHSILVQKGKKR